MPVSRQLGKGRLLRPWLNVSKHSIQEYAAQQNTEWIEDPSNQSDHYSRNYLRLNVLPVIAKRWPGYAKTLTRFSQQAAEQSELLADIASQDLSQLMNQSSCLNIQLLRDLSLARQKNTIRHWALQIQNAGPSAKELNELFNQLSAAQEKSISIDFAGGKLRSYKGELMIRPKYEPEKITATDWPSFERPLTLSNGQLVDFEVLRQMGLREPNANESITVHPRQGGEKCCPAYRDRTTDLKTIYQELSVPPWARDWLPLIYFNDQLVAVPGIFVAKKFVKT